jgi:transcription antitermination protein NusB
MGMRRQAREWALQLLFQDDFNREDPSTAYEEFWAARDADPRIRKFTEDIVAGVHAQLQILDDKIQEYAEHWNIKRMGGVERNAIRMALFEMLFCPEIPPVVSIDEAVEITKLYSSNESGKFVNGILDRALRDIKRPSRNAGRSTSTKE